MLERIADRCVLILMLDVAVLVVFVSLAASPLGSVVAPTWIAAATLGCWIACALVGTASRTVEPLAASARVLGAVAVVASVALGLGGSNRVEGAAMLCTGLALFSWTPRTRGDDRRAATAPPAARERRSEGRR